MSGNMMIMRLSSATSAFGGCRDGFVGAEPRLQQRRSVSGLQVRAGWLRSASSKLIGYIGTGTTRESLGASTPAPSVNMVTYHGKAVITKVDPGVTDDSEKHVSVQLVSKELKDTSTGRWMVSSEVIFDAVAAESELKFQVPKNFGVPGAIVVRNDHTNEFHFASFTLVDVDLDACTTYHFHTLENGQGGIFFRGSDESGSLKIYDYDVYDGLGDDPREFLASVKRVTEFPSLKNAAEYVSARSQDYIPAGVDPTVIKRVTEFKSMKDATEYVSAISYNHISSQLDGLTIDEALAKKKLFDYLPFVARLNAHKNRALFFLNALFFLRSSLETLKQLFRLPGAKRDTSSNTEGAIQNSDIPAHHQVFRHFTNYPAVTEALSIASKNRQTSLCNPGENLFCCSLTGTPSSLDRFGISSLKLSSPAKFILLILIIVFFNWFKSSSSK